MKNKPRIIFSAGGTGGHIFPALAVANAVCEMSNDAEILFVGSLGKMEMDKVPANGYNIKGLWISGLQRGSILKNILIPIKLIVSTFQALWILWRFRPDVVVGFGGYASGPILYLSSVLGIPTMIHEQNALAGITNKKLATKVSKIIVASEQGAAFFPKSKTKVIGNPIRKILQFPLSPQDSYFEHFGLDKSKKIILIIGGSLGARTLNRGMVNNIDWVKTQTDKQFLWQMGDLYFDDPIYSDAKKLNNVFAVKFIQEMNWAMSVADLVISRAGALSVSEIIACEKPSILVPSPNVAEDHQTKNAMVLVDANAAEIIIDKDFSEEMKKKVDIMLIDKDKSINIVSNMNKLKVHNVDNRIAIELLSLIS